MSSRRSEWVRIFDIPDITQHKKGFTIYKVVSMLYPEHCPDAVTKISVWKRYSEFKKLHRDLKSNHLGLHLRDKFPVLPNHSHFKRFNKDVIRERREGVLNFLEYVGREPALFTSHAFVKFFESSHTPSNLLKGSINSLRADLQLPAEPEYSTFVTLNSEDDTQSDTDSISTMSSLSPLQTTDMLVEPISRSTSSLPTLNKKISCESLNDGLKSTFIDSGSVFLSPTPPLSPTRVDYSSQYIIDAAQCITKATELEIDKEYEGAFSSYKQGIDILLQNVKSDKDANRREMVRFKIEKYLLRAEKIYNLYLSPDIRNIQELTKSEPEVEIQRPLADLYKYKVIKIIENGMLVMQSETQQLLFVKVIYKTLKFSKDYLILPDDVPYMVKLQNYYNCENALFLILRYSCGKKISEYLKILSTNEHVHTTYSNHEGNSDNESELSYSDLINEYSSSKTESNAKETNTSIKTPSTNLSSSETENLEVNVTSECSGITEESPQILKIDNILIKSKQLISSMEQSLHKQLEQVEIQVQDKFKIFERKLSDRSIYDDFDIPQPTLKHEDVVKWGAQLLLAVEKLHVLGVICCDLNFNNLLIDENGDLLLTYMFSMSDKCTFQNNSGNAYLAPELCTYETITKAVDFWSYGIILYELLVGMPLKCVHPEGILPYTNLRVPKYVLPEGRYLLKQLLTYEPKQRLGCGINGTEDIKTHPFFNSISWEKLEAKCI